MPSLNLTPKEIVAELDKFIVGQTDAKKAVAVALRNRWRRKKVSDESIKEDIYPHNILMIGPTGVGKTEIARRLAKLVQAPFIKVEATKFTEVGYVGRDVESIIRDLVDIAINDERNRKRKEMEPKAIKAAEERIVNALVGENSSENTKHTFYQRFKSGELDNQEIEIEVEEAPTPSPMPSFDIPGMPGSQMGILNLGDVLGKSIYGKKYKKIKLTVKEAYEYVLREETENLIDEEKLIASALKAVQEDGIVFLDEIDKIASRDLGKSEVNREGVQRDLLPIIEGTVVSTKYGSVKTEHILFITSGAFHLCSPSDLLPELQGRLPIRVELNPLSEEDLLLILKEPIHSLPKQYKALFAVENIQLEFDESGMKKIASIAANVNNEVENIGARRLHTIIEKLLEDLNFSASDMKDGSNIVVDEKYVMDHLANITTELDLSKFIL